MINDYMKYASFLMGVGAFLIWDSILNDYQRQANKAKAAQEMLARISRPY